MGARSRRKGARGERQAAAEIARLFGVEARRGCQHQGAPFAPDIRTAIARVHFEVKRAESLRLYQALDQAVRDAGGNVPVVLYRANHQPWVAIVRLDDLPQLAVQLYLTLAKNA
ncbi:MAG: hypothetical protein D6741_08060 [Planctomycetota bacterium]|nr:MAG: hypothetical protein D6741_08060 [Planctomycetota bacterium]